MRLTLRILPLLLGLLVLGSACSKVPYTGRSHAILVPWETEIQLGADAYAEALASETVLKSGGNTSVVQRVGERIRKKTPAKWRKLKWRFSLIESDTVNAFALPGGKVAVYQGILPVMQNEAGMAAVVGHEAAHVIAQHGAERISGTLMLQLGLGAASIALGGAGADPGLHDQLMGLLGLGATVGVVLPFSRANELESDHIGAIFMAKAGYDPREAPKIWERMSAKYGDSPVAFLSTHPRNSKRIERLNEEMPGYMKYYNKARRKHGRGADLQ